VKRLVILGSTGSIGRSTLDVVARYPDRFSVIGLGARSNVDLLAQQALQHRPGVVSVRSAEPAAQLTERLAGEEIEVVPGEDGLSALAAHPDADLVVNGLVGGVGLVPTLKALESGKAVAMANKEPIVMAGPLLMRAANEGDGVLLPVDSEPSAIWQCLHGDRRHEIQRIILTASGGPFYDCSPEAMATVTPEQTLEHPTWRMGPKITVDSATLMNKGMEMIEAHHLFGVPFSRIEIVIHRQSIVHSLVEFVDGSILAQLACPDMRLPIQYALTYPERWPSQIPALDLIELGRLTFGAPNRCAFPGLDLCYRAVEIGGTMPAVLSGSDEVAVEAFLDRRIAFTDIPHIVEHTMAGHTSISDPDLEEILDADRWARRTARSLIHP